MSVDYKTLIKLLETFRDNPRISGNDAVVIAGVGKSLKATQMHSKGLLIAVGYADACKRGATSPLLFTITDLGLYTLEKYIAALKSQELKARPMQRINTTSSPNQFGNMALARSRSFQPYVPPRWESVR